MRYIASLVLATTMCACAVPAWAQDQFPVEPVRVIVPYPAGGIVDVAGRIVTDKLAAMWNQPIITEARPGANSNIGTDAVAKAAPDGYTWLKVERRGGAAHERCRHEPHDRFRYRQMGGGDQVGQHQGRIAAVRGTNVPARADTTAILNDKEHHGERTTI